MRRSLSVMLFSVLLAVGACATPRTTGIGEDRVSPQLAEASFTSIDGAELPLRVWPAPTDVPKAVIVGVHGMNDYGNAFAMPAEWFVNEGVSIYAYDQRGFGETANRGRWAGSEAMTTDLSTLVSLVREEHPSTPLFVLGLSMGGAVALAAADNGQLNAADGVILVAPAVWGWRAMNPFYKMTLWLTAHLWPSKILTGASLEIWPSDNIEMLRAYSRDPLVIKETRVDAIYGLVTLMDDGYLGAGALQKPAMLAYGAKDEIVPARPVADVAGRLGGPARFVIYDNGYHMVLRDLQRETVYKDILTWIEEADAPFPSIAGRTKPVAQEYPAGTSALTAQKQD